VCFAVAGEVGRPDRAPVVELAEAARVAYAGPAELSPGEVAEQPILIGGHVLEQLVACRASKSAGEVTRVVAGGESRAAEAPERRSADVDAEDRNVAVDAA